jgi:hypothetical protein
MSYHGKQFDEQQLQRIAHNWMDYLDPNKPHRVMIAQWIRTKSEIKNDWICERCGDSVIPEEWAKSPLIGLPSLTWTQYKRVILDHYTGCSGEAMAHLSMYQSALSRKPDYNWFQGYFTSSCLTGTKGVLIAENLQHQNVSLVISSKQGGFREISFAPKFLEQEQEIEDKIAGEISENVEILRDVM